MYLWERFDIKKDLFFKVDPKKSILTKMEQKMIKNDQNRISGTLKYRKMKLILNLSEKFAKIFEIFNFSCFCSKFQFRNFENGHISNLKYKTEKKISIYVYIEYLIGEGYFVSRCNWWFKFGTIVFQWE